MKQFFDTERRKMIPFLFLSILISSSVSFGFSMELYKTENNASGLIRDMLLLSKNLDGYNIVNAFLTLFLFLFLLVTDYHRILHKEKITVGLCVISGCFGILNTCGLYMFFFDELPKIKNPFWFIAMIIVMTGWSILFWLAAYWVIQLFRREGNISLCKAAWLDFYEKHVFICSFIVICICWLPWIISYYPASMDNDVFYQIDSVTGILPRTNHHPWLTSFIIGAFFRFGQRIHNENAGIFLFIIVRDLTIAVIYASCSRLLRKMNCPRWTFVLSTLFYAVTPVFGAYAKHAFKDTFSAAIFCFFIVSLIDLLHRIENSEDSMPRYLIVGLVGLAASLSRNNFIYCILPVAFLIVFYSLKRRKAVLKSLILLGCVITTFAANAFAYHFLNVAPGSKREMLSLPIQQISRTFSIHGEEFTDEDREQLGKWFENYDEIPEVYDPILSDPVKNIFRPDGKDTVQFALFWMRTGFHYPIDYLEATVAHTSGYYAFTPRRTYDAGNWNANLTVFDWLGASAVPYKGLYDLHYNDRLSGVRAFLDKWTDVWDSIPLLAMTDRIPLYTWGMVLIGYWMLKVKKYWALIPVVSVLLCILSCIASPVNDCFRYFVPAAAAFPAFGAVVFGNRKV